MPSKFSVIMRTDHTGKLRLQWLEIYGEIMTVAFYDHRNGKTWLETYKRVK